MPRSVLINNTAGFHIYEMDTLGWELTVCNTLEPETSPARQILSRRGSFGCMLYDFLSELVPLHNVSSVLEVGGGYGFLMRDFLDKNPGLSASMLDISPFLLQKQKDLLEHRGAFFFEQDFLAADTNFLKQYDLVLLNENIADFPTACTLTADMLEGNGCDGDLSEIRRLVRAYGLSFQGEVFNFNFGAVKAVELLCSAGVPYVYLSEHSCETEGPERYRESLGITPTGNPERIALKGHDEYTIRFSHLEAVARHFNYRVFRGNYTDIFPVVFDEKVNFILTSKTEKDEHEIIRLFISDLYKYEYLVLVKD